VNVTATTARRQVNAFLATYVGNLLLADEPALTVTDKVVWRVPVDLTNPVDGRIGRVGEVDVDVESGELFLTEEQITQIKQNALHLTALLPYCRFLIINNRLHKIDVGDTLA
jgi:hypothetical protein